jgi:muramoyltetrapeptide carboxypeptidase
VRGGYGASRLLPHIDWQGLIARQQRDPLLICGHSDFTAIQWACWQGQRHHLQRADAGRQLRRGDPRPVYRAPFLAGAAPAGIYPRMAGRRAELPGGRHPVGRKSGDADLADRHAVAAAIRDGILVVEDINEHPFRVERMLLQLLHSGMLAAQKAVSSAALPAAPNDYDAGYDLPQVFDYLRQQLPAADQRTGFGHEQRTVTLPLGARARW